MTADDIDRSDIPEVTLVFNGALEMTEGKTTGQAFQSAARLLVALLDESKSMSATAFSAWQEFMAWHYAGTRVISRVAKTQAIFERICGEVDGYIMVDEGFTEVEAEAETLFVSYPYLHKDRPKLFNNKKVPLL